MLRKLKNIAGRNLHNLKGWSSKRRIIVIESDDWGAIRLPSHETYSHLLEHGLKMNDCPFCRYDSLASNEDLTRLFDVLLSHKAKNGTHPVITANTIVANPDFEKIRQSEFTEYHYELFTESLKRYPAHDKALDLWKQGMSKGIFHPQLHGREHINISRWMRYLKDNSPETRMTFDLGMFGISTHVSKESRKSYMAAFDYEDATEANTFSEIISDAQTHFETIFGYKSKSFIAPNYVWGTALEGALSDVGVEFLQGSRMQLLPQGERTQQNTVKHFTGEKNKLGQIYLVRNCTFEPSATPNLDAVAEVMKQISSAFFWNKPAIIGSHRVNFVGHIDPANRDRNLELLDELLRQVIKKWPGVEFMTSDQLGNLIKTTQ